MKRNEKQKNITASITPKTVECNHCKHVFTLTMADIILKSIMCPQCAEIVEDK